MDSPVCRLIDEGGDWDRRNRLKVYQGLHLLTVRDFKKGGELLIDALSTFTASELMDYDSFVTVTVISCMVWMERVDIKKKVNPPFPPQTNRRDSTLTLVLFVRQIINSPEIRQVFPTQPALESLATSLYNCEYAAFFQSLGEPPCPHPLSSLFLIACGG